MAPTRVSRADGSDAALHTSRLRSGRRDRRRDADVDQAGGDEHAHVARLAQRSHGRRSRRLRSTRERRAPKQLFFVVLTGWMGMRCAPRREQANDNCVYYECVDAACRNFTRIALGNSEQCDAALVGGLVHVGVAGETSFTLLRCDTAGACKLVASRKLNRPSSSIVVVARRLFEQHQDSLDLVAKDGLWRANADGDRRR